MADGGASAYALYAALALSAVSAAVQYDTSKKNNQAAQDAADANAFENQRANQEQARAAQAAASEAMSDRMREARRRLSIARVLDAEGGGSFAAQAINIQAAENEDIARIGASTANAQSSLRDDANVIRVAQKNANSQIATEAGAIRARFLTEIGSAAANAYVGNQRRKTETKLTRNDESDYRLANNTRR
jgi:hypothetical protein